MNPTNSPVTKGGFKSALGSFAYWLFAILFFETLLHLIVFESFSLRYLFVVGFSATAAAVISLILSFLRAKASFIAHTLLTLVMIFLYGSQLVYFAVFGSLYSLAMTALGGDALGAFWKETAVTMLENMLPLASLFIPLIVLLLLKKFASTIFLPTNKLCRIGQLAGATIVQLVTIGCLLIGGTGYFTNHYFYHSVETTTDQAADRFGLITALRLELTVRDAGDDGYFTEEAEPTPVPEIPVEYNVLEFDFDALNAMTEDQKILAINEYCAALTGTNKNAYTGLLQNYNLILICAESFATGAIDPELTPTLYRLATEGLIFKNYYNTYPNTTTDGEYSLCQGLYPDTSRGKSASSFYASRKSYLPFTLGNLFMEQRGIQSYGYHNYYGSYYGRQTSHPNLGYEMKFAGDGMKFSTYWPASDLEMMEQSIDDYIGMEQFHAYYMTFSGHYKYDVNINPMVQRNWDVVKDMEYSAPARGYLSCNYELEKAMAYLMQRLEEAGVAEKTAIVIAGDHFPYGLKDAEYSELVGYEIDDFTKFKSSLIFWVGGMEQNIIVNEYCCNVDVLPTILNLWGFDYDSRMLAGTDVFSDGEHMAVLIDKSFFNDKVWLNASSGEIKYLVDESTLPEGYIDNIIQTIKTKFSISSNILNTAYWNFVYDKGKVWVGHSTWE